jgi:hypothetical protein
MKKIITILATLMLTTMSINFAKAEGFAVGVTGAYTMINADGQETEATVSGVASSGEITKKSVDNNVFTGSVFAEYSFANVSYADSGVTFGVRYTPGTADVSDSIKTRTDTITKDAGTGGAGTSTYKAQAEIDNYVNYYLDIPLFKSVYVKAGWSQIDVNTKENNTTDDTKSQGTYGNTTLDGVNYGIGVKGENGNIVWKLAYEATNFDTLNLTSTTSNKIKADLDTSEVNLSVGYKF